MCMTAWALWEPTALSPASTFSSAQPLSSSLPNPCAHPAGPQDTDSDLSQG